jgi:hypothetical protein
MLGAAPEIKRHKTYFTSNYCGCGKTRSNGAIETPNALASGSHHR